MSVYGPITTPAATGGAGVAAATVVTPQAVRGEIAGIFIQYNDAPPAASTDVGIKTKSSTGILPNIPILTLTNGATDGYYIPRKQAVDPSGAVVAGVYEPFVIEDQMQIDLAGANDGDSVSVWFYTKD